MNNSDALAALADIELPAPPDWGPVIMVVAAILLIVVVAIMVYMGMRKRRHSLLAPALSPRRGDREKVSREALVRLARLQQEWSSGALDARATAYRLGTLLRLGLGLPQLHAASPPTGLDAREWAQTLTLLHGLRYAPAPEQTLTPDIFARAQHWLCSHESGSGPRDV